MAAKQDCHLPAPVDGALLYNICSMGFRRKPTRTDQVDGQYDLFVGLGLAISAGPGQESVILLCPPAAPLKTSAYKAGDVVHPASLMEAGWQLEAFELPADIQALRDAAEEGNVDNPVACHRKWPVQTDQGSLTVGLSVHTHDDDEGQWRWLHAAALTTASVFGKELAEAVLGEALDAEVGEEDLLANSAFLRPFEFNLPWNTPSVPVQLTELGTLGIPAVIGIMSPDGSIDGMAVIDRATESDQEPRFSVYATNNDEVTAYVGTSSPITVTTTELINLGVLPVTLLLLADLRPGDKVQAFFPEAGVPHDAWALAIETVGGPSVTLWADIAVPCHHLTLPFGPAGLKVFTAVEPVLVLSGAPLPLTPDPDRSTPERRWIHGTVAYAVHNNLEEATAAEATVAPGKLLVPRSDGLAVPAKHDSSLLKFLKLPSCGGFNMDKHYTMDQITEAGPVLRPIISPTTLLDQMELMPKPVRARPDGAHPIAGLYVVAGEDGQAMALLLSVGRHEIAVLWGTWAAISFWKDTGVELAERMFPEGWKSLLAIDWYGPGPPLVDLPQGATPQLTRLQDCPGSRWRRNQCAVRGGPTRSGCAGGVSLL